MQFFLLLFAALALLIGVSLLLDRYCTFCEWMEGQGLREADFIRMQQAGYIAPPSAKWN
jgi:hypothetical protein